MNLIAKNNEITGLNESGISIFQEITLKIFVFQKNDIYLTNWLNKIVKPYG